MITPVARTSCMVPGADAARGHRAACVVRFMSSRVHDDLPAADVTSWLRRRHAGKHPARPWIYWLDFSTSVALGWSAFALGYAVESRVLATVFALVAALALMRAVYFVHELWHLRRGAVPGFALAWHVLAGLPTLIPALMIGGHGGHHRRATYGTREDPEYASIARWSRPRLVWSVVELSVVPPALVVRWALLGPVSWVWPRLRRLVVARMSTLATNYAYIRASPQGRAGRAWLVQEAALALWTWTALTLLWTGALPWRLALHWWGVVALAFMLNQIRTLVAHRYEGDGRPMTADEQFRDTLTLSGGWLTELWAPLGDRYHALHHCLPDVPYHALGRIHRELLERPGVGSRYKPRDPPGVVAALRWMWRRAGDRGASRS